jgi:hypothetical protein
VTRANGSDGRRAQIADRIAAGILPGDGMKHTHAGRGRGRAYAGCDHPISRSDMELESVFADGRRLHFHLECFTAWWKILEDRRGTIEL